MNEYILSAAIYYNDDKKYKHQPQNIEIGFYKLIINNLI